MSAQPRVVVIHPPQEVERDAIDYPYFTGLPAAGLVTRLRLEGFFVHLLDAFALPGATAQPLRNGRVLYGVPYVSLLEPLRGADFDVAVVHFTPWHLVREPSAGLQHLLARLRELRPHARLLGAELYAGGMHRLPPDEEALQQAYPELDGFVSLEGEETLPELLRRPGDGPFLVAGRAASAETLARCEPAWTDEQLGLFRAFLDRLAPLPKVRQYQVDGRTLPLYFSRGCPFTCAFCTNPYPDYRAIPLPVLEERLDRAVAQGFTRLFVLDDAANVRPDFDAVLEAVAQRGLRLDFPNGLRADLLSPARIEGLARVAEKVTVSAESAVARLQEEVVGKRVTPAHVEAVADACAAAGLPLLVHWMVALPGETREETVATLDAARRLLDTYGAVPLVQFATPLPGTKLATGRTTGGAAGEAMQHAPTFLPEGTTAAELARAVALLRQRGRDSQTAKVIINTTYRCNNHCVFCAVGNRIKEDQPLDTLREVLDTHAQQGIRLLDLDGGEPTLHPDLFEVIAHARGAGYETINITTNGRRLAYPDFARRLLASGITSLLVSIHGPNATVHDGITGVPGSFKETLQGIRNVMDWKPPSLDFGINATLSVPNYRLIEQLVEVLYPLGVEKFNFQFLTPFGRAAAELVPPPEEAAAIVASVIDRWKERVRIQVINLPYCYLPGHEEHVAQDLGKLSRKMVFVTREEVNLYDYLAATRAYDEGCVRCLYRVGCDGRYDFSEVLD